MTGMRGLCNGLGPAMFGVIFYLFHVDLNGEHLNNHSVDQVLIRNETTITTDEYANWIPGPPFVFGALMVVVAIFVAIFIPETNKEINRRASSDKKCTYDF